MSQGVGLLGRGGESNCLGLAVGRGGVLVCNGSDAVEHIGVDEE